MKGKSAQVPVDLSRVLAALEPLARLIGNAQEVFGALAEARRELSRLHQAIGQATAEGGEASQEAIAVRARTRQEVAAAGKRVATAEAKARSQLEGLERQRRQAEEDAVVARQRARALDEQADREARERKATLGKELAELERASRVRVAALTVAVQALERQIADGEAKLAALHQAQKRIRQDAAAVASG